MLDQQELTLSDEQFVVKRTIHYIASYDRLLPVETMDQ